MTFNQFVPSAFTFEPLVVVVGAIALYLWLRGELGQGLAGCAHEPWLVLYLATAGHRGADFRHP